jgi:Protein of unknown function (DUF3551)
MGKLRLAIRALAALMLLAMPAAAPAAENGAWCASYQTDMGRTTSCAFGTRAQCQAAIGGIGSCQRNSSSSAGGTASSGHERRRHRH